MTDNELLSVGLVAQELGLDRQKLQRWETAGLLPFCVHDGDGRKFFRSDFPKIMEVSEIVARTGSLKAAKHEIEKNHALEYVQEKQEEDKMVTMLEKAIGKEQMMAFFQELGQQMKSQQEHIQKQDELLKAQAEELAEMRHQLTEMKSFLAEPAPTLDQDELIKRIDEEILQKRDDEIIKQFRHSLEEKETERREKGFWKRLFGG
jgi:DNA-binding transcriptional MerR regulator